MKKKLSDFQRLKFLAPEAQTVGIFSINFYVTEICLFSIFGFFNSAWIFDEQFLPFFAVQS